MATSQCARRGPKSRGSASILPPQYPSQLCVYQCPYLLLTVRPPNFSHRHENSFPSILKTYIQRKVGIHTVITSLLLSATIITTGNKSGHISPGKETDLGLRCNLFPGQCLNHVTVSSVLRQNLSSGIRGGPLTQE